MSEKLIIPKNEIIKSLEGAVEGSDMWLHTAVNNELVESAHRKISRFITQEHAAGRNISKQQISQKIRETVEKIKAESAHKQNKPK